MKLEELKQHWDAFGETDPMWAIITQSDKRGGHWDEASFFEIGRREIDHVMATIETHGWLAERKRALDFGCGLGRLAQALCTHFSRVDGVDIAASMIDGAQRLNRFGERCAYHVNERSDLKLFDDETFDFIYSRIVLQHMRPEYAEHYVREFIRLLRPGGVAWFQMPSHQAPPPETAPLPDGAFRAELSTTLDEVKLRVGETLPLTITVRNASSVAWPGIDETKGHRDVALGNHWWLAHGSLYQFDDQRIRLPRRLEPGDETDVVIVIGAPPTPGLYRLEFDMVEESVAWFGQKGSPTLSLPVEVAEGMPEHVARQDEESEPSFTPRMEMYGTKPQQVLTWVDDAGGRLLEVSEDPVAGDRWYSFRYIVTR